MPIRPKTKRDLSDNKKKIKIYLLYFFNDIYFFYNLYLPYTENNMSNPCHSDKLSHIKRIEGQVRGISKMIEEKRYCIDILNQLKAIRKSINSVENKILKTHLKSCISDTLKDENSFDEKVEELVLTLKR